MIITSVRQNDDNLEKIATLLYTTSKIVTITGASISTNAGISDFRSKNGIYASGHRHLFHSSILFDPERWLLFYKHIADMRRVAKDANPTTTHRFIRILHDSGKLVRAYTQNIDCLEDEVGLSTDIQMSPRSRFCFQRTSLHRLRCSNCQGTFSWDKDDRETETLSDPVPPCPRYTKISDERKEKGKRVTVIGKLRPDIVLYDEQDSRAEEISAIARHVQSLCPDVLLIMGTSLTTHGVKLLIRNFAKAIHKQQSGKVVFVNRTKPAKIWEGVIDYWVEGDCEAWVEDLVERRPAFGGENNKRQIDTKVSGRLDWSQRAPRYWWPREQPRTAPRRPSVTHPRNHP
ncbi:DHS-like NAD/FAD-binding domain-containing protein [Corynascus novoguineensis]|uniref:DHS-like NAD/FAD-binding domain-containing protein n=1 Tax=Corynascus novoguineensis TaxID=1126955 RepID=A0AAN7CL56_9PEZI|nr:DHS-like NAD/FAD-binding domain-containing protein [Corynascus novoguineensis]